MSSKKKVPFFKLALAKYINDPEQYSRDIVVYHDEEVVIINDVYPKSKVHLLILPRDLAISEQHPRDAFKSKTFVKTILPYIAEARLIAVKQLREKVGSSGLTAGNVHNEVSDESLDSFIKIGVHSEPSLNNLHIHVISKDFLGAKIKHKKHYNSFNTDFFVDIDSLINCNSGDEVDKLFHRPENTDMVCSFEGCDKVFSKFSVLKQHLVLEYTHWVRDIVGE